MALKHPSHLSFDRVVARIVRVIFLLELLACLALGVFTWQDGGLRVALNSQSLMNAFVSLLGFVLTFIPEATERLLKNKVRFSSALKIAIVLFIFGAQCLGEVYNFYELFAWWDVLLHATSGVILALVGFMLVDALNDSRQSGVKLSPFFVALFAFIFALASGALWEIFEYACDRLIATNMQKFRPVDGVLLEELADGTTRLIWPTGGRWRFDAGLIDSMVDLICDAVSALAVSVLGYAWLRYHTLSLRRLHRARRQEQQAARTADGRPGTSLSPDLVPSASASAHEKSGPEV